MTAQQFRKVPVVIEAVQWSGDNESELTKFTDGRFHSVDPEDRVDDPEQDAAVFDELHATWVGVNPNDWIIKGTQGEFYPCRADVFSEIYEPVQ